MDARKPWTDTGIDVQAEEKLVVCQKAGGWAVSGNLPKVDGNGHVDEARTQLRDFYRLKLNGDAPFGCLLAAVGNRQNAFPVGVEREFTSPTSGRLYLRINDQDGGVADNVGSISVQVVSLKPGRPEAGPPKPATPDSKLVVASPAQQSARVPYEDERREYCVAEVRVLKPVFDEAWPDASATNTISPDGKYATVGLDRLFEVPTRRLLGQLQGRWLFEFTPDSRQLIGWGAGTLEELNAHNYVLRFWDARTGAPKPAVVPARALYRTDICVNASGTMIAVSSSDGISIYPLGASGQKTRTVAMPELDKPKPQTVAFSADDAYLFINGYAAKTGYTLQRLDLKTASSRPVDVCKTGDGAVDFSPAEPLALHEQGQIVDMLTGKPVLKVGFNAKSPQVFCLDGRAVCLVSEVVRTKGLVVWERQSGKPIVVLSGHPEIGGLHRLFRLSGGQVAAAFGNRLLIWKLP